MSPVTLRNSFISLSFFILSGVLFGGMIHYVSQKSDMLSEQVEVLKEKRSQESSYFKLSRQQEETVADRELLSRYFLSKESDSIDFLSQVESIAPKIGLVLETESLELIKDEKNKKQWIKATFSFSGVHESVYDFVKILETLPYMLRVTKVNLSTLSSTNSVGEVTMQVQVLNYEE